MTLDTTTDLCLAETPLTRGDGHSNMTGTDYLMHETNSGEHHYYRYEWSNHAEGQDRIDLISREKANDAILNLPDGAIMTAGGLQHYDFIEA